MASLTSLLFFLAIAIMGLSPAIAQDTPAESRLNMRVPRSPVSRRKLCRKYGICEGYGGFQGGYQGYQGGYTGAQGYPGPPINIAISQSQSAANEAGGGYNAGYYPYNYQYNAGYPHAGYQSYGGYQKPGYFGNGLGGYNNQFNGNYYGGIPQGGYGFHGGLFDEATDEHGQKNAQYDENDHQQGRSNSEEQSDSNSFAVAGSFAAAGRRS